MRSLRGSIALSVETQTKIAKEFGEMSKIAPKIDRRRTSSQRNRLTNFYWEITGLNPSYPFASAFCVVSKISSLLLSRSEEHTSELQSQSHISYAVFCLKKKKK